MDITDLILSDHAWFREQFIALYDLKETSPPDVEAITEIWRPLGARLDVHAIAEEEIFYPRLLELGQEDPEEETLDAIGDHNDIRDGIHDAARHPVGTEEWWAAVAAAREANDEHMAEEEREGIAEIRLHAPAELREQLGAAFAAFMEAHPTTEGVDTDDKDPEAYVDEIESDLNPNDDASTARRTAGSLGIGSLKREGSAS